ncbi:Protein CBG26506 [Caenorhabditis briggsae]|uniref:Protein CBG26506 n=1 Tax=Caenorhabditis briggsae TaxID=6238 RepID=B6ILN9_CAEBR|nr:Protein CBG26506 [Caenorhabditis briggsae]CAS00819.1 Protein CBG26506 [Caenorhabditis briggsae]
MSKKLRLDEILKKKDLKSVDLKGLESDDDVNNGPKSLKIDMETKFQNLLKEQFPTLEQVLLVISSQLNHIQNENLNNFMDLWAELRQKSGEGADFNMVISEKELASMEISFKKKFEILKNDFEREKMAHKNTQFTLQKCQIELFAKNREIEKLQERIQELEKTENEQKSIKSLAEEFEKLKIGMLGDQEPSESARIEELEDLLEESDAKILDLQEELEDVKTKMFKVKTENHHLKIEADELGGELESEIFRFSEKLEFANGKIKMMDLKIRNLRKDSDEKIQKLKHSEFKKVQEILKLHHRLQTEDFGSDHKVQESLKLLENQKNLEIAELKDMLSNQGKRFQLEVEEKMILEAELQKLQTTLEEKNELRKKWAAELSSSFESTRAALKEQLKTVPMSSNFPTLQKTLEEKKGAEPNLDLKALQATLMEQMKMYLAHSKNAGDNSLSSSKC